MGKNNISFFNNLIYKFLETKKDIFFRKNNSLNPKSAKDFIKGINFLNKKRSIYVKGVYNGKIKS